MPYQMQLLWHLVIREFILQYKRSFLGVLWSLLLPVAQLLVLILIFQKVIPLKIEAYPLFLFCALLPWNWFSNCLNSASNVFTYNRDLVRRPNFEPYTLVIVNTLSNLLLFLIALPLLFLLMLFYSKPFTLSLLVFPLLIIIQSMLTIGVSLILATINSFYSDVQHMTGVLVMMLFFLTPVFYSYESVSETFRVLYFLNPMAALIQNYRLIFFYGISPGLNSMIFVSISSIVALIIGYVVYSRQIHNVVDVL
jgi:homopolymeric O-antigen transport system permease protein